MESWPNQDMASHGGGAGRRQPITYDPDLKLIYVTTGNPQPVIGFANRKGDNLYTASICAVHADTGKLAWSFQVSPHDTHDWDSTEAAVLFDAPISGQPRKLLALAARNGKFVVLGDRATGKAIVSTEFVKTNWSLGYDAKGLAIPNPEKVPSLAGSLSTPNQGGATSWYPATFDPMTGLFYVSANQAYSIYYLYDGTDNPQGWGGNDRGGFSESAIEALDYQTGKIKWSHKWESGNTSRSAFHRQQRDLHTARRTIPSKLSTRPPANTLAFASGSRCTRSLPQRGNWMARSICLSARATRCTRSTCWQNKTMTCLDCGKEMASYEVHNASASATYDVCESCGGLWLDKGELDKVADQVDGDIEYCSTEEAATPASAKVCPRCPSENLLKVKFLGDDAIILERCDNCKGFWLDGGQIDQIDKQLAGIMPVKSKGLSEFIANTHLPHYNYTKRDSAAKPFIVPVLPVPGARHIGTAKHKCPNHEFFLDIWEVHGAKFESCPKCAEPLQAA